LTESHRTLIETFLPVDEISEEAKKEKNGRAPTFEMHYWWTRKPLITARAAVLGALLPADFDQQEFKKLLGLEHVKATGKRAHNYDIPLDRIEKLKKEYMKVWGDAPIVLDPFAGGGSIPFEAMRVGVDVIANDYNPVAHLIERTTFDYPQKYGERLYKDVEMGLNWIFEETKKELEQYYPTHNGEDVVAYIWAWSVKCPKCGFVNPLVGQWWLANTNNKKIFLSPSIKSGKIFVEISEGPGAPSGTCSDAEGVCFQCGSKIPNSIIRSEILEQKNEILLAVVVSGKGTKKYFVPSPEQHAAFQKIQSVVKNKWTDWIKDAAVPLDEMPVTNDVRSSQYLKDWYQILNDRQLALFIVIEKNINRYLEDQKKEYSPEYLLALASYFSLIFGKHIDRNCRAINWDSSREIIGHALANRGISMMWNHAEVNPFVKGSGTLIKVNKSILDGLKYAQSKVKNAHPPIITRESFLHLKNVKVPIIITDPPYYDDVPYPELSGFFYAWEKRILQKYGIFDEILSIEDLSVGGNRDEKYFKKLFQMSCRQFYSILSDDGILILFFAHSSITAWDFVIDSLQKSGLRITATWPLHTENPTNPLARGNASIMSSIIIVARKRHSEKNGYIEEIQDEVQSHISKRLDEFWDYGLRGADLTVSAMGSTLDILTQYSEIKSYTGEMKIEHILKLVQGYVAQYVLNRYMKNASGLDAATSFYLYTRLSQIERMPFDTANLIAKSMNVDLKLFEKQGLIETSKKGKSQGVKILNFSTRETNPKQSLIDCVQFVMTAFAKGGYTEIERELATIPFSRNEIKDVLEALLSLPTEDPERQVAQKILERMGQSFPKHGQTGLDNF
jgi:adenine-specific DNA methylase